MAAIISAQTGNWSSTSTWTGGVVPGNGDRVIISHNVTVDTATTIGESLNAGISGTGTVGTGGVSSATLTGSSTTFTSQLRVGDIIIIGSSTRIITAIASDTSLTMGSAATIANGTSFTYTPVAIFFSGTSARLNVNENITIKGGVAVNYASTTPINMVTVAAGKGIEFDASSSPATTSTMYPWVLMAANNQYWTMKFNGTSGSRCFLRSNSGGGNAYMALNGFVIGAWIDAAYTDFSRLGSASIDAFPYWVGNTANSKLILNNCVIDSCGLWTTSGTPHASSTIRITSTKFTNPLNATYSLQVPGNSTGATTIIERSGSTYCVFGKSVNFSGGPGGWSVSGAIFERMPVTAGSVRWALWDDTWVRQIADTWYWNGNLTNSVFYWDNPAGNNPHFLGLGNINTVSDIYLTGCAFYFNGTVTNGNCITHNAVGPNPINVYMRNNIMLPNSAGTNSGAPLETGSNISANYKLYFEHNTAWVAGQYGIEAAHLQSVVESPNRWGGFRSNLMIGGASSASGYMYFNSDVNSLEDAIPPATIDKNARYNIVDAYTPGAATFTNQGNGYASKFSTTPGTTDINLNASGGPSLSAGSTTNFLAAWDLSLGGAGTDDNAWNNVYAGTAGYTPAAFLAYVREQCRPTNSLLRTAGHDGSTIGASNYAKSTRSLTKLTALRSAINTRYGIAV